MLTVYENFFSDSKYQTVNDSDTGRQTVPYCIPDEDWQSPVENIVITKV